MKTYLILIAFCCSQILMGQDVKQQINDIKQNQAYMNAESTDENREEAYEFAMAELVSEANGKFTADIPMEAVKGVCKSLDVMRDESVRVFVYALVTDLAEIAASYPNSEVPDRPAAPALPAQTVVQTDNAQLTSVSEIFARMNTLDEIKSLLREYKSTRKVKEYNWVTSLEIPRDVHVVIFRDGKIVGILMCGNGGKWVNLLTSKEDAIDNYSRCRAIWYK